MKGRVSVISALEEGPGTESTTKLESLKTLFVGIWIYLRYNGGAPLVVKFSVELDVVYILRYRIQNASEFPTKGSYIYV